ncbi:uncharacterized protein DUF4249 [Flavobacterium cutihirudinis]|uniref:Uncharacterized protein DUF4249 n=1 Tax=Flavobacterium cutihirudinis TaxID=1265740 RepID=A0A3D9FJU3_9FLAO|nr:DUF4249 domain-containing protein [Flavobacterium cutihirudinis]RED19449.1 uncharacterized protein DUF4249 [Flavobacterium cutihirudinis]
MNQLKKNNQINKVLASLSLVFLLLFTSCDEVVNLDLETAETKIVIDAEILWKKGTDGSQQVIKISKTASYYDPTTPKVSGAKVRIENSNGDIFTFNETEAGQYVCTNFVPVANMEYKLFVDIEGESFTAVEKLITAVPIDKTTQELVPEPDGNFSVEVKIHFTDPAEEVNYYMADFNVDFYRSPQYTLSDDEFSNGNEKTLSFSDEKLQAGKTVNIVYRGVSKNFFDYMNLILEASNSFPISIPPGNIRGNIINTTNPDKFAFGYFRLCEADTVSYLVK